MAGLVLVKAERGLFSDDPLLVLPLEDAIGWLREIILNTQFFTTVSLGFLAAASVAVAQDTRPGGETPEHPAKEAPAAKPQPGRETPAVHAPVAKPAARAGVPHSAEAPQAAHPATMSERNTATVTGRRTADVTTLNRNVQSSNHYHAGAYRPPEGYAEQRWTYGQRLPASYYASNYWLANYVAYALFAPPSGAVWVRVGNDALLVDQSSGEVIQVQYGVFY